MASSYNTKTQLIAIYRLEFYKNKKNWKLYENVKSEPQLPSENTNKLNKTYNVDEVFPEPEYDEEQVSQHNKAFLHEEPDDGADPQPPDTGPDPEPSDTGPDSQPPDTGLDPRPPDSGLDPQTPISALPESAPLETAPSDSAPPELLASNRRLYSPHSWSEQPWNEDKAEDLWHDPQIWCGAEAERLPEVLAYDQCDGPHLQQNLWAPASHFDLKPAADPLDPQPEHLTPSQMRQIAEEWLQRQGYPVQPEDYAPTFHDYDLVDDSTDFVRGAHAVPHSSEIDLSITQECGCTCSSSLCALSARQLARAVRAHHAALVLLLREHALRETLSSCSHLRPPIPFEDYPTRDTDPLRPPDCVLSGSHWAASGPQLSPGPGRGRGRLHRGNTLIGIGMGRPYRL